MFRDESKFAFALAVLQRRDYAGAEAAFNELLGAQSRSPAERAFLLNKRGVARIGLGDRERARADFMAALDLRPSFAPALTNLGNLALEDGLLDEAIERYEAAISADPDNAVAHLNLSVALKREGRLADAVRAMKQSQRLEGRAASAGSFWRRARRR